MDVNAKVYSEWEDDNWNTLIYSIRHNKCILMLGPDAAVAEGQQHPLTEILANDLAEKLDPGDREKINASDLTQVAQCYYMRKGRQSLEAKVSAFYEEKRNLCSNLHRNLAALPFDFIVTATPDNMLIEALEKEDKKPVKKWYHFNGNNPRIVEEKWSKDEPLVFYLYGTLDKPNSLLLTENDLLDYLVALVSNTRPMPANVLSELQDESKSFLFLGFGFRHWYLRILLNVLQVQKKGSFSFAMEQYHRLHADSDQLWQTLCFFQRSDYKINIFKQSLNEFASQLKERYKKYLPSLPARKPQVIDENAAEVFICHASEDKDFAAYLYRELEAAGLRPWLDKKNLRGGDQWHRVIDKTLKKIDYFVVLQSQALAKKLSSYVIREINAALDRKSEFRRGIRFVIPAKIDDSPLLEELKDIQAVDLTGKKNINDLIDAITRDFKKRGSL